QRIGQLDGFRQWSAAREASSVGLARQPIALHCRLVLVDKKGETAELADWRWIAGLGENIVAADRLRARAGAVDPPDGAVRPGISEVKLQALGSTIFGADGIEGLLIL